MNSYRHKAANGLTAGVAMAMIAGALALCPGRAASQDLGDMFFTAGTTIRDDASRHWGYVVWQATDPQELMNRSFAIYKKSGDAASTNTYSRIGIAAVQTEPRVIRMLLSRAANLDENLAELETDIDTLFHEVVPDASLSLEEKLSEVIRGSLDDPGLYGNLLFLAKNHPSIAMALGQAFAARINSSGRSTFEIRTYDASADQAGDVMGRTTVEAGVPPVMPAPVQLREISESSAKGHLNVRLRWTTPDALRRMSLLNHGFNIYRMTCAYAEDPARLYNVTPPTLNALTNALATATTDVARLNHQPVLIDEETASTNDYFFIDDNNRFATNGVPLTNAAAYYYFVTARDLLGRDGIVSTGLLATVHDRMAPRVPRNVSADNVYAYVGTTGVQNIRIQWDQNINTNDDITVRYYVYRWRSLSNMYTRAGNPTNNRISGAIGHVPGRKTASFVDAALTTNDFGKTYWYTVRAEDNAVGGGNLSGNSAPAYAVLRDRAGPKGAGRGTVYITVEDVSVIHLSSTAKPRTRAGYNFRLVCDRTIYEPGVAWAEFSYTIGVSTTTPPVRLSRIYFSPGNSIVAQTVTIPTDRENGVRFFCRVGSNHGRISTPDDTYCPFPVTSQFTEVTFAATATYGTAPAGHGNRVHVTEGDSTGTRLDTITGVIPLTPDAREWRIYRRVNFGALTLIDQGEGDGSVVATNSFKDKASATLNGGTLCYYYQLFDEHGNPGPLTLIECFTATASAPLPTPVLAPVQTVGTATNPPTMALNWFCPPPGVVRFEIAMSDKSAGAPSVSSPTLSTNTAPSTNSMPVVLDGVTNSLHFGIYRTGRVGGDYGTNDSPDFSANVAIQLNTPYTIMVRAIGEGGRESAWSNPEQYTWYVKNATATSVPWPARPLPPVQTDTFHERFEAVYLDAAKHDNLLRDRVGVRIGEIPASLLYPQFDDGISFQITNAPTLYLYTNAADSSGNTVIPFVLYRYQITNATLHRASGDVVQVSPLMEDIAYVQRTLPARVQIKDPYIFVSNAKTGTVYDIYMLDTQPVIKGASYKYLVVRFGDNKEIERIIPSNDVEVP